MAAGFALTGRGAARLQLAAPDRPSCGMPWPGARQQVSTSSPGPVPTCSPVQVNVYYFSLNCLTSANSISYSGPAGILTHVIKPAVEVGLPRGGMCLRAATWAWMWPKLSLPSTPAAVPHPFASSQGCPGVFTRLRPPTLGVLFLHTTSPSKQLPAARGCPR